MMVKDEQQETEVTRRSNTSSIRRSHKNRKWAEFVATLEPSEHGDNYNVESSLHFQDLEQAGPPVPALEFPIPTILSAKLYPSVKAIDHRDGKCRSISNVLIQKPDHKSKRNNNNNNNPDKAYLLRKIITKTSYGAIRAAVVLRRRGKNENGVKECPWVSTDELVAVKMSSWSRVRQLRAGGNHQDDPVRREVAALQLLGNHHPNVMGCYEVLQDEKNLYTIMPFHGGGSLHSRLFGSRDNSKDDKKSNEKYNNDSNKAESKSPKEDEARDIFRQLLKGLYHLQCKGLWHRDISLDNLLISRTNEIKITDMGMSLRVPYSDPCNDGCITDVSEGETRRLMMKTGNAGKPMYLAPELLSEKTEGVDGFACDLWSAGVILFVLCVGLAPFKAAQHSEKRYAKISSGGLKSLMKSLKISISPEACDLLQNMLWEDPKDRLSLMDIMHHPWVMGESTTSDSNSVEDATSGEESVGSLSSTEPTQESKLEELNPIAVKSISNSPKADLLKSRRERRTQETRDEEPSVQAHNRFTKNLHQLGPKLKKNAQQLGPRLIDNAQQIGPKLKCAIAHVQRAKATPSSGSNNSNAEETETDVSTPGISPRVGTAPQQILNRLKTVIPNKAT